MNFNNHGIDDYILDIDMPTYNHEKYIAQAIESVLSQKTNFKFRLIIGEDCSTDGTRNIVERYASSSPDVIFPIFHKKNVGPHENGRTILSKCTSKYIAILEGDDYWNDPYKLQKQVDFLNQNSEYVMCFSSIYEVHHNKKAKKSSFYTVMSEETYGLSDLAKGNFVSTPSVMFRNGLLKMPDWIDEVLVVDYVMYLLVAQFGKIKYFPEPMAVYRIHNSSIWGSRTYQYQYEKLISALNYLIDYFKTSDEVVKHLRYQYAYCKAQLASITLSEGNTQGYLIHMKEAFDLSPKYMDDWLINSNVERAKLASSQEYKIGWAMKHPWFMVKNLFTKK